MYPNVYFFYLGLNQRDDHLKMVMNIMNIFSSDNPEEKISATATMDNSQAKSSRVDSSDMLKSSTGQVPTCDIKFCFCYLYSDTSLQNLGINDSLIFFCVG